MTPTKAQIERVTNSWSILADERLEIEVIGSYIYAKGSELACLRLYYWRCKVQHQYQIMGIFKKVRLRVTPTVRPRPRRSRDGRNGK